MKRLSIALFVLLGLFFLANPTEAKEVTHLSKTVGQDGFYHEIIDLSEYEGEPVHFKIKNGTFEGFYNITDSESHVAAGEFISVDHYYLPGKDKRRTNMFEVVIASDNGDYTIDTFNSHTVEEAFDFTNMSISNGNFIKLRVSTIKNKEHLFKIHLEQGKEYLYKVYTHDEFKIVSPSGEIVEDYLERFFTKRSNSDIANVLKPKETGTYIFQYAKADMDLALRLELYELVDTVDEIKTLTINDRTKAQTLGSKRYAVKSSKNMTYTIRPTVDTEDNYATVLLDIDAIFKRNEDSETSYDAYGTSHLINERFRIRTNENDPIPVYNDEDKIFVNLYEWSSSSSDINVSINSNDFAPKTGDAAKEKVMELKAEPRDASLVADPIDAFAGNFVDERTLLSYSGNNPLSFSLHYDSIANTSKSLGGGFTHNFETYVQETEDGLDVYWTPNSVVKFVKEGSSFTPVNKKQIGTDVAKTDTGYQVIDKDKQIYLFDTSGKLITFTDKVGLSTTYTYADDLLSKVENDKGQSFSFLYTSENQLSEAVDGTGRTVTFEYSNGRLSNVVLPRGYVLSIGYSRIPITSQNYKVSSFTYDGIKIVQNQYDDRGRVSVQYDANRNRTDFSYDEYTDDALVTTTISTGNRTETLVHDQDGNLLSKTDGEGFTEVFTYDLNRNLVTKIDKNGNERTYEYDHLNRLTKETNPDNSFKEYSYDVHNNITKIKIEDGKTVISQYDGGRLLSTLDKAGRETAYNYDSFGNVTKVIRNGETYDYTYDLNGYLISTTISNQTTAFKNDDLGRVVEMTLADGQKTSNVYDADNNTISSTDVAGNTTTNEYNAYGDKIKTTDESGDITVYSYDNNGNLTSEKKGDREIIYVYDRLNLLINQSLKNGSGTKNKEVFTYNKRGDLIKHQDADSMKYALTYDGNGNLLTRTVGNSVEKYEYDDVGNNISYMDGNGNTTSYTYDAAGNMTKEVSPSGAVRLYDYDLMNRLTSVIDGEGYKTIYNYDDKGNLIKETKPNGAITRYEYNSDNQQIATINALGEKEERVYNELGQLITITNALGETVQSYEYNNLGKISKMTDGNGHTSELTYDSKGNLLEVRDALGNVIEKNEYNQYDELITALDALGNKITRDYDPFGNMSGITDSMGNVTTFNYSSASRLTSSTDALGTSADYKYDAFGNISRLGQTRHSNTTYTRDYNQNITKDSFQLGAIGYAYDSENNLVQETNARGQELSYKYDKNGRVIKEVSPEGVVNYTYDSVGNQLTAISDTDSIERTYDLLGRVTSKTQSGKTIGYSYDKRGDLTKIVYPDGKDVEYTYDTVGNLLQVVDWNGNTTTYDYNANNQLVKTTNWNGTSEVREYDAKGQLVKLQNLNGTDVISSYTYAYDANGNIVKENDMVLEYDELNRLVKSGEHSYGYSEFGNITDFTVLKDGNPYTQEMSYGRDNELNSIAGVGVNVDKGGNLLKYKLNGKEYVGSYDSKNRLIAFDGIIYRYDSENNRIGLDSGEGITDFVVDNDSDKYSRVLVEETDGDVKHHVYGNGLIGTYTENSFETNHYDYRGSLSQVTDESGFVIGEVSYDEYGSITQKDESITSRFLYNGKYGVQTDINGLYHMRTRYYNPDLKRFMNRDVISGNIEQSQTLNRYAFVNGNPISYNDPFGLAREAIQNTKSSFMDILHTGLDLAGMLPGVGIVADAMNAVSYLAEGNTEYALLSGLAAIPIIGDAKTAIKYAGGVADSGVKGYNGFKGTKGLMGKGIPLLPNEGKVGTYKELVKQGVAFDNITPHHMPAAAKMKQAGVKRADGVSMNMEQPHPGAGGRHRETYTYGLNGAKLRDYLSLSYRDSLAHDINDARKIYMKDGVYSSKIREGLLDTISKNRELYPELFKK